jgi:hypothetical protein
VFSFFKRKKPLLPVPEWASFFSQEEYNRFISHLEGYLKGKDVERDYEEAAFAIENEYKEKTSHGLNNIAQQCKQAPANEWKKLITTHFDSFKQIDKFGREFEAHAHDFNYVSPFLGVRLYNKEYISSIGDDIVITRNIMDGIIAMLVFDFPHSVSNVKPEQSVLWNKSEDELFEIGISNIRSNYKTEISSHRLEGFDIFMTEGDHFFVPNILLELQQHPSLTGTYGSLISIPHRHCALFYPIEDMQVAKAVNHFIPLTNYMYEQGPGSISPKLYWYYQNSFQLLPYELTDRSLKLMPPDDFVSMLNLLE